MIKFVIRAKKNPLKRDQVKFYPQMAPGVPVMLRTIVGRIEKRRVTDPAIDLSVIAAILSSNVDIAIDRTIAMAGEVGLSGEIRPVTRIRQRIAEAAKLGFKRFLLPEASLKGLGAEVNIQLIPVRRVEEALQALFR